MGNVESILTAQYLNGEWKSSAMHDSSNYSAIKWDGRAPRPEQIKPDVKSGLIISGPELVDNKDRKEQLKKIYPEAVGGEMEGEGKKTDNDISMQG